MKEFQIHKEEAEQTVAVSIDQLPSAVRFHRKKGGLTQAELARLACVGKTVIFDIEKGKRTIQLDTLLKVLAVLNITLIFRSPMMEAYEKS